MFINERGEVLNEQNQPLSLFGRATWCTVLHTNDIRIQLPDAGEARQQPELAFVPRRAEILFSMLADTVQEELELSYGLRGLPVDVERVRSVCSELGLNPLLGINPLDLSGGQRAKLSIALCLLVKPRVLVLDNTLEPIDRKARRDVIAVLRRAVDAGMRLVELATAGPPDSTHIDEAVIASASGSEWVHGANVQQVERWGETDFAGLPDPPSASGEAALELCSLSFRYGTGFSLSPVDLTVNVSDIVWLAGPNGAGKTTLLKCMALLLSPQTGRMVLSDDGQSMNISFPTNNVAPPMHRHLLYQFQEPDDQIYCATVREELLASARHTETLTGAPIEAVAQALGLASHLEDSPWNLTRSSRRLLTFGAILCARPRIALLDEPTAELDAVERRRVALAMRQYIADGGACIVVSHDEPFMRAISTRTVRLEQGMLASVSASA